MIAGGSMRIEKDMDPDTLHDTLARRFLEELGRPATGAAAMLLEQAAFRRLDE